MPAPKGNKFALGNNGGRPPKYDNKEDIDKAIKYYFDSITRDYQVFDSKVVGYEDEDKKKPIIVQEPRLNNAGEPIFDTEYLEIPSILGCCIHMGIVKDTWNQYSKDEMFSDSIMRAKQIIEEFNIKQLYRKDQVNGIMFNLKNNYGWKDKTEFEAVNHNLNEDITTLSPEQREIRIKELEEELRNG